MTDGSLKRLSVATAVALNTLTKVGRNSTIAQLAVQQWMVEHEHIKKD